MPCNCHHGPISKLVFPGALTDVVLTALRQKRRYHEVTILRCTSLDGTNQRRHEWELQQTNTAISALEQDLNR